MKIRVTFDATKGVPVRDGDVDTLVQSWIDSGQALVEFTAGTANVIEGVRLALADDRLLSSDVTFIFDGIELTNNGKTGIMYWPVGFCDHSRKRLSAISNNGKLRK